MHIIPGHCGDKVISGDAKTPLITLSKMIKYRIAVVGIHYLDTLVGKYYSSQNEKSKRDEMKENHYEKYINNIRHGNTPKK